MSERYPRIRIHAQNGALLIREGLTLTFYMPHPHAEVAPGVIRSLDAYLRVVGPQGLGLYDDGEGAWRKLDEAGWARTRHELHKPRWSSVDLVEASSRENRYRFHYHGKPLGDASLGDEPGAVSAVSFWLPTEYLEEHGPERVRELALELAAPLPFSSGNAGLSFNCETDLVGVNREVHKLCFRHPGLDIPAPDLSSWDLGTRVRGPTWLTFLGQPVLGELGGTAGLRARLHSPGTTVQQLDTNRAVVTLGPWPEAGDTEQGLTLPAYRELARVLEPWLHQPEDSRPWARRFLD